MPLSTAVLDSAQLKRIESVHRGFLYQHLYAVACLLLAPANAATKVVVEADEDVEVVFPDRCVYIQIKTRSDPLGEADIAGALGRFERLRNEHTNSERTGTSSFVVVSNVAPGPKLLDRTRTAGWHSDTTLVFPGSPPSDKALPEAWSGIPEALSKCAAIAASLPFRMLVPETLVLKLAATVMAAAAGIAPRGDHAFQTKESASLFEQIVIQLQEFPTPPAMYRPQAGEPELVSTAPMRLISGFSGAGKTAWVAQASLHSNSELAYFDIGDTPGSAIAIPLARELAGRFFGKSGALGEILLPGATGLDMLRALARKLTAEGIDTMVIIDNAHRAATEHMLSIVHATVGMRYLLLCQPSPTVSELEAALGISAEMLCGWTTETIAADVADAGCKVTPDSVRRLLGLTAGLPLYVQNAARIAAKEYGGNLSAFCADVEKRTHTATTAQEIILAKTFEGLQSNFRDALAIFSISDLPLERAEVAELLKSVLSLDEAAVARFVRELRPTGAIEIFGGSRIKVHDAMRILGRRHLDELGPDVRVRAYTAMRNILSASILIKRDLAKLSLLVRVFAEIGELEPLVEFATDEIFHELGLIEQVYKTLETASRSGEVAPEERFAALDGLVFYDLKVGNVGKAKDHLELMAKIAAERPLDDSDRLTLAMKQMLFAAAKKDGDDVAEKLSQAAALVPNNPIHRRIFQYNAAHALFQLGRYEESIAETERLIPEYL